MANHELDFTAQRRHLGHRRWLALGFGRGHGHLDWMLCAEMDTVRMDEFLGQVSRAHPDEFIVMIVDGASSHRAKDLGMPENIRLLPLPAYGPELNPQEHVWDELREKEFPNRVFNHLDAVIAQLRVGLPCLAEDHDRVRSQRRGRG
ncbi:MAG: transposase [Pseudomonadota bacterium]|nr:transposase [Pseudomonadota bacterium]